VAAWRVVYSQVAHNHGDVFQPHAGRRARRLRPPREDPWPTPGLVRHRGETLLAGLDLGEVLAARRLPPRPRAEAQPRRPSTVSCGHGQPARRMRMRDSSARGVASGTLRRRACFCSGPSGAVRGHPRRAGSQGHFSPHLLFLKRSCSLHVSGTPVIIDSHQDFDYTPGHQDDQGLAPRPLRKRAETGGQRRNCSRSRSRAWQAMPDLGGVCAGGSADSRAGRRLWAIRRRRWVLAGSRRWR
jgi:hypothetical protein